MATCAVLVVLTAVAFGMSALEAQTENFTLISSMCREDIRHLVETERHFPSTSYSPSPRWKTQMLDSYGRFPAGVLEGNLFWMGDFTQCTDIAVWKNASIGDPGNNPPDFRGKYCLLNFNRYYSERLTPGYRGHAPIFATFAICVPSSCRASDVQTIVNDHLPSFIKAVITEAECQTDEEYAMDVVTKATLAPFVFLLTLVAVGTFYDVITLLVAKRRLPGQPTTTTSSSILKAFSAYTNTKKLLETKTSGKASFSCIHGLRALSMALVIGGHTVMSLTVMSTGKHNPIIMERLHSAFWAQPVIKATYTVTSFFFMTGFLATHTVLQMSGKLGRFNILVYYFHRLWRLSPAMLLLTLSTMGSYQLTRSGPLWTARPVYVAEMCRESWWQMVLYIGIYQKDIIDMAVCMPHLWYIEAELFYYFLAPIVLFPMIKKHWSASVVWVVVFAAATVNRWDTMKEVTMGIKYPYRDRAETELRFFRYIRGRPWCGPQPFMLGMLLGYFYYHHGNIKVQLSKVTKSVAWTVVLILMVVRVYGQLIFEAVTEHYESALVYDIEITFGESVWSICLAWIIWACITGNGGIVNDILSWKFFFPIGRLSFCAYLIHFQVMTNFTSGRREQTYADVLFLYVSFWGMCIVVLFAGWILCLLVEAPAVQLEGIVLQRTELRGKRLKEKVATKS